MTPEERVVEAIQQFQAETLKRMGPVGVNSKVEIQKFVTAYLARLHTDLPRTILETPDPVEPRWIHGYHVTLHNVFRYTHPDLGWGYIIALRDGYGDSTSLPEMLFPTPEAAFATAAEIILRLQVAKSSALRL